MAKKRKRKKAAAEQPSHEEILDALAADLGVDESDAADGDTDDAEADDAPPAKKASAPDPMAGLGDIFNVPGSGGGSSSASKKKKKKPEPKKPEPEPEDDDEEEDDAAAEAASDDADDDEEEAKPAAKKPASDIAGIEGLFNVSGAPDPTPDEIELDDPLIDDEDVAKFERSAGNKGNMALIAVIVLLVVALGAVLAGDRLGDIKSVFDGTYREKKDEEKRRAEEEWRKEQLAKLEKYGNLSLQGTPPHAILSMQLEGDTAPKTVYAQFGEPGTYTELRLGTIINNLKIKKPIVVKIASPGYTAETLTLSEPNWDDPGTGTYVHSAQIYLKPTSQEGHFEQQDRMQPFAEIEEEKDIPAGVIKVNSTPPGAKIKIGGVLLTDDKGQPILTPATIEKAPVDPERIKEAEADPKIKTPEPKPFRLNTPPDQGFRVDVFFDDATKPKYATWVYRDTWTCTAKDEKELKKLPEDARPALKCDYSFQVNADFPALEAAVAREKKVEEELRKQQEETERIKAEAAKRAGGDGDAKGGGG